MAETVKVIVRCRPMNGRENGLKCKDVVNIDSRIGSCGLVNPNEKEKVPPKRFTFDGAYGIDSTTEQIYADIGFPLVEGVTEGYNGTIFAYGQTGCGKSFSMQGIKDPATQRGIIPRAFDHIFETIQVAEETKYLVHASYLEIYNEEIRDLLGKDIKHKLDLKEHPEKGVYCQGLSMHPCTSVRECNRIMGKGWDNRSTGATLMNADSSRSHSIFTIYLERIDADETGEEHIRAAKLNLVDLAGSERQSKTGSTGDRLKEATKINLSLSALGNVISALVDGKSKHIPYRDSKLTRMLQDSLGGNTKTLMVACLSPADNNYDETLSTLRYANRAKNIKNKPKINEDPKDALLREYQEEINRLKAMLRGEIPLEFGEDSAMGQLTAAMAGSKKPAVAENEEEVNRLKEEYEEKMATMQQEFDEVKISRDQMEEEMAKLRQVYDDKMSAVGSSHISSPGQSVLPGGELKHERSKPEAAVSPMHRASDTETTTSEHSENDENLVYMNESGQMVGVGAPVTGKNVTYGDVTMAQGSSLTLDPSLLQADTGGYVLGTPGHTPRLPLHIVVKIPVRLVDGTVIHMSQLEMEHRLPEGAEVLAYDANNELVPVTLDVRTQDGDVIQMTQAEIMQGLPPGYELMSVASSDLQDDSSSSSLQEQIIQHAVHLATVKTVGEQGIPVGPTTPATSPTGQQHAVNGQAISTDEAMQKLQALQRQMVGGEEATNEEVKKLHKEKKQHVEERKRKLAEALANMQGEDIMLGIYDNIQDELKATANAHKREQDVNESLQREIKDLQAEFEFDRIDYLDTIRRLEQEMAWKQEVIDRLHPCLRRDCNYINLDKIRAQSNWDEVNMRWNMPRLTVDKTKLPGAPGRVELPPAARSQVNGVSDEALEDLRSENKFIQMLNEKKDESKNYFKSQRQEKLLNQRNQYNGSRSPNQNGLSNGHLPVGNAPWQNEPLTHEQLKAAQVHGQISHEEFPVRKPTRLDALPLPNAGKKSKKKKGSMMELY